MIAVLVQGVLDVTDPAETLNAPRMKVGAFGGIDAAAIARAEAALKAMSAQFGQWMQDELDKLDAARAAVTAQGYDAQTAEGLYFRAHDLKGLGSTYQFPLVTRIAGSMCKLLDDPAGRMAAPLPLIDAHIDAIKAVVRDNIQTEDDANGVALATTLEAGVARHKG